MSNPQSQGTVLALKRALEDPRLQLRSLGRQGPGTLHLWLVEKCIGPASWVEPMYGFIIPSQFRGTGKIGMAALSESRSRTGPDGNERLRFRKLIVSDTLERIDALTMALLAGNDLAAAAQSLGFEPPPEKVASLAFGADPMDIDSRFAVRPFLFLESSQALWRLKRQVQPYTSPFSGPCFCASLTRLDKMQIFAYQGRPLVDADDLVLEALELLSNQTGLDFRRLDAKRFGNLEWLVPASDDLHENPLVALRRCQLEGNRGVRVEIRPGALAAGSSLLIRCRARQAHAIVYDRCIQREVGDEPLAEEFPVGDDVDSTLVSMWVRSAPDDHWDLWHEEDASFIRQITIKGGLIGLQGTMTSASLQPFMGTRSEMTARALEAFSQIEYSLTSVIGDKEKDYFKAEESFQSLLEALHPPASGGAFFTARGEDGEPGMLTFMKWFLDTIDDPDVRAVTLMDPFFDDVGIELFAKARSRNIAYKALTISQLKSKDDTEQDPTADPREPQRALRIQVACNHYGAIFSGLDFEVLDLRSPGGGDKQFFHDRYLLLEGVDGKEDKGFNLSNSIQAATKFHPLLITPIPSDVLPKVKEYVRKMLVADRSLTQADLRVLYASRAKAVAPELPFAPDRVLDPGFPLPQGEAVGRPVEAQAVDILGYLEGAHWPLEFAYRWQQCGIWFSHTTQDHDVLTRLAAMGEDSFPAQMVGIIGSGPYAPAPFGFLRSKAELRTISVVASTPLDFKLALRTAESLFDYPLAFVQPSNFPIRYAIKVLLLTDTQAFVHAFCDMAEAYARLKGTEIFHYESGFQNTLRLMLETLIEHLYVPKPERLPPLLGSRTPLLRAIGATATKNLLEKLGDNEEFEDRFRLLDALPPDERRAFLAAWVGDLRIEANRRGEATPEEEERRRKLFSTIVASFQEPPSVQELTALAVAAGGPLAGSWADTTDQELLEGLVSRQLADVPLVAGVWLEILFRRFERLSTSDPKDRNDAQFFWGSCVQLTEVAARRFSQLEADDQRSYLKRLDRYLKTSLRMIRQPFKRRADYTAWHDQIVAASWIEVFLRTVIYFARHADERPDGMERLEAMASVAREAIAPFPTDEEGREHMPEAQLQRLRQAVDQALERLNGDGPRES